MVELEELIETELNTIHVVHKGLAEPEGLYYSNLLDTPEANDGNFLIDSILKRGHSLAVPAWKGEFKTITCLDMALSLATGTKFLGRFDVPKPCRVLYASWETTKEDIITYLRAIAEYKGCEGLEAILDSTLQIYSPASKPHIELTPKEWQRRDAEYWKQKSYDVVIIDTATKAIDPKCSFKDGRSTQHGMMAIERHFGSSSTFVHQMHVNKPSKGKARTKQDITGSGIAEHCRAFLILQKKNNYEAGKPYKIQMSLEANGGLCHSFVCTFTEGWGPKGAGYSTSISGADEATSTPKCSLVDKAVEVFKAANVKTMAKSKLAEALGRSNRSMDELHDELSARFDISVDGRKTIYALKPSDTGQSQNRCCPASPVGQ